MQTFLSASIRTSNLNTYEFFFNLLHFCFFFLFFLRLFLLHVFFLDFFFWFLEYFLWPFPLLLVSFFCLPSKSFILKLLMNYDMYIFSLICLPNELANLNDLTLSVRWGLHVLVRSGRFGHKKTLGWSLFIHKSW